MGTLMLTMHYVAHYVGSRRVFVSKDNAQYLLKWMKTSLQARKFDLISVLIVRKVKLVFKTYCCHMRLTLGPSHSLEYLIQQNIMEKSVEVSISRHSALIQFTNVAV